MTIKFNEVTWYSKLGALVLFLLVLPILTFYIGMKYEETSSVLDGAPQITDGKVSHQNQISSDGTTFSNPLNGTYTIDEEKITLVNGKAEEAVAPGSAMKIETSVFGQPVYADLNGDGQKDAIFFVSQETGGTGIFFYVVAAVNQGGKYTGSTAIFLGDRIAPQTIDVEDGVAAVNYADRKKGEAMAAQPSVGVTKRFTVQAGQLVESISKNTSDPFVASAPAVGNTTSNIVGYFAGGSFYWYIPVWMEQNWNISNAKEDAGFTISPKATIVDKKFSDIVITVNQSTESYNALTLYDQDRNSTEGKLIINEVLLNKHGQGTITVNMETNTRIYHVQREIGGNIYDRFYIDGSGGKTAYVVFHAATEEFPAYESKIREFVEGIGKGLLPQG